MDIITSFLDRFKSPNKKDDETISTEMFDDKAILAICILMIEVSRSDDEFDEVEREKILSILKKKHKLDDVQLETIMKIANRKNEDMISLYEWTSIIKEIPRRKCLKF